MLSISESALRRLANREEYRIEKDRARSFRLDRQGGYRVINNQTRGADFGPNFDASLDDVREFFAAA